MATANTDIVNFMSNYFNHKSIWELSGEITLTLAITLGISVLVHYLLKSIHNRFMDTKSIWDDAVIGSLQKPAQLIVWVIGISLCIDTLHLVYNFKLYNYILTAKGLLIIIAVVWFIMSMITKAEKHWYRLAHEDPSKYDKATVDAVANLLRVITILCAVLSSAEVAGVSISGIIALAGGSSLGIAFASKDLMANFFGALMIYLDKPFKVGEWIRIPKRDIEGYVEKIGLRCTIIKTLDKRPLYVPNSVFPVDPIENPSRMSHRKIYETVVIRLDDAHVVGKLSDIVTSYLQVHSSLDHKLPHFAKVDTITKDGINLLICAYTRITDMSAFYTLKQDIILKVTSCLEQLEGRLARDNSITRKPEKSLQASKGRKDGQ